VLVALAVLWLSLLAAERLARVAPSSLLDFLTRVFGLLLAAIAVQMVVDGVRALADGG
jgi:multiple antibiotic resistance protein